MAAEWHYRSGGSEFGPVSTPELIKLAADGGIVPETQVRRSDGPWVPASKVDRLFDRAAEVRNAAVRTTTPPPPPEASPGFATSSAPSLSSQTSSARYEVLDEAESDGFKVEVLAYPRLGGAKDHQTAATVYFANQAGIKLKQVRITLRDGEAIAESGALHFMLGRIEMESKIGGVAGLGKAMMNKFVTKEAAVMPRYRGTGQIYLEPSFSHFLIYRLGGEEVVADKGMFYCGQGSLDVGSSMQKNVSSALFGGEGLFQTRIRGTGIVVLESPVPADEVLRIDLKEETLQVDGNFALMRSGRIEFSVEKSTRSCWGLSRAARGCSRRSEGPARSGWPRPRRFTSGCGRAGWPRWVRRRGRRTR